MEKKHEKIADILREFWTDHQQMFHKVVYVVMFCCLAILVVLLIIFLDDLRITPGPMLVKVIMGTAVFIGICGIIAMFVMIISFWREDKAEEVLRQKCARR